MITVRAELDHETDLIVGRNGTFPITAIEVTFYPAQNGIGGLVSVDGIGKRDKPIRGGFAFRSPEAMDRLAVKWLQKRGLMAQVEMEPVLDAREASIVLAGLRNLQMDIQHDGAPQVHNLMTDWDTYSAPTLEEIDELCERINTCPAHACPYCQGNLGAPDLSYNEDGYNVAAYTCPACGATQRVTNIPSVDEAPDASNNR